jgi:AcrR family transcriptional regulator
MDAVRTVMKQRNATRAQLLEAACEVFAEKGYRKATIAEICRRGGANIAAVNYYFGNKETLYAEAWRLAFQRSLETHPPDGGIPATAPCEERLRGHILSLMRRIIDPGNHEFEIVHKELAHPTGLLAEVMRGSIEPIGKALAGIVAELLGFKASDQQVRLCQMSIMAQCLHPMMRERFRKLFPAHTSEPFPLSAGIEAIAEHVTRFSLAGIQEIRRQIDCGELDDLKQ